VSAHALTIRARRGTADDIAVLVRLYACLGASGKGDTLWAAAQALAAQRVAGLKGSDGQPVDPGEWLADLASSTMPTGDGAAGLVEYASGVEPDARRMMFQEGCLSTVLCASEEALSLGEGAYLVYMSIRGNADEEPPDPAPYIGIKVPQEDYLEWQDDGWVVNEQAWQAEIRRRCILDFAAMIAEWRGNFFDALLSGRQVRYRAV
jgi:hypothetical protein